MRYMLLIYGDEKAQPPDMTPEAQEASMKAWFDYGDWLRAEGITSPATRSRRPSTPRRSASRRARPSRPTDRSPRRRSSSAATTCSSARTWTRRSRRPRRCPGALCGSIEVRPIQKFDEPEG